ncbi:hypothetical protein FN846DRAFT_356284 [Sphaerosporella brunnea]|uniref:Mitochondrial ATPase inhibitor, IATP-domain-containing protein n=1 Tax=Sphaerosporella brunnea TaxID=1250544 RepID=A0A5J5EI30_9PEZI|nr:hypothetical protein FN846DRAFT_356284 [Sphaerosporella brunnea]
MVSFTRSTTVVRTILSASRIQSRTVYTTPRLLGNGSTRHGNDPEVLEKGKQSVLNKNKKDSKEQPHWHEELASESEAVIKAQRDEIEGSEADIAKLQLKTKKISESR